MPSRSEPLRRSSRKIKEESDVDEPDEAAKELPTEPQEESPAQIRKVDDDNDEQEDIVMGHDGDENSPNAALSGSSEPTRSGGDVTTRERNLSTSAAQPKIRGAQPARRFQTRAGIVRKSEADRKRLEQEEAQRRQRQLAEAARGQRATPRGPRGGGRARGTEDKSITRGEKGSGSTGAQWAFEQKASNPSRVSLGSEQILSGLGRGEQDFSNAASVSKPASENTSKGKGRASTKNKEAAGQGSVMEEESDLNRTDIEQINLISDEDDEEKSALGTGRRRYHQKSGQESGLRPIRLEKHEHIKRAVGVAANKLKTEQIIKEENATAAAGAIQRAKEVTAQEVSNSMEVDQRIFDGSATRREVEIKAPSSPEEFKPKSERKRRLSSKDRRLAYETIEEQQERLRYEKDLRKIRRELGALGSNVGMLEGGRADSSEDATLKERDDKLYLFQLPPMIPMLVQRDAIQNQTGSASSNPTDPTLEAPVKREPGSEDVKLASSDAPKILTAGEDRLPEGIVGQLNVHQSGKVTLDWGGTSMVVNWGSEVDFLQDAVLVVPQTEEQAQTAYSLGHVREKLVVTPDWQKIYE